MTIYDYILTGRKFHNSSFLPSPESDIKMEDKYLPILYYSLGATITLIGYTSTFVLANWKRTRCPCCAHHDLESNQRSSSRGDTDLSPAIELSIVHTKPDPIRPDVYGNTSIDTADDLLTPSIRNIRAATI
jgi:hypothetical protein